MQNQVDTVTQLRAPANQSRARQAKPIPEHALSVRIPQMCEMLGIGASKAQELVRTGAVDSVLLGKTRLISVQSIHALLNGKAA